MYYYDLHCHTSASKDSPADIRRTARVAKRRGLDGMAVTDHDKVYKGPLMIEGLDIIPGCEVTMKNGGHLLAYFIKKEITPRLGLKETVAEVRSQGGYAVLAHPLRDNNGWIRKSEGGDAVISEALEILDGLESGNASVPDEEMAHVAKMAYEAGLIQTAGSDMHMSGQVGFSVVAVNERPRKENFVEALRDAEVIIRPEAETFRNRAGRGKRVVVKMAKMLGVYNNEFAKYLFSVLVIKNYFRFRNKKFERFEFDFKKEVKS